jgi:hypothetical protein
MKFSSHILFYLILFIVSFSIKAQYNSEFLNFDKRGRSISINGEFELGSNGIYNDLLNKFVFGGSISNQLKDASNHKLNHSNVIGANLNYSISAFFGRKPKYSYLIGFKDQHIFNSTFTKDFYQLLFYGNKPYLNETKKIGGTNINYLRFQELKFGCIWHKIDSTGKAGISLSVLNGQNLFYVKTKESSSLFTNFDGTELIFDSKFNIAVNDPRNKKKSFAFSGIGASADIFFENAYKSKYGQGSVLTVNVNNLGFIHWNQNSIQYNSDSIYTYNGYQINNLLDLKDPTLSSVNQDSIINKTSLAQRESFNVNIPTNLIIINKIIFTNKFAFSFGFRYLFNSNFKPYGFTNFEYKFTKKIASLFHIGYGGYTKLNFGLSFSYNSKNWYFELGSNSLQGFIFSNKTFGYGAFISLARKFKN